MLKATEFTSEWAAGWLYCEGTEMAALIKKLARTYAPRGTRESNMIGYAFLIASGAFMAAALFTSFT